MHLSSILPQSKTAHDDTSLVQSVEPAAVNAGSVDIARSAPHTLLTQRDGLNTSDGGFFLLLRAFFPRSAPLNMFLNFELQSRSDIYIYISRLSSWKDGSYSFTCMYICLLFNFQASSFAYT